MDKDYQELKKWLEETKDQPLETMAGFFDARINLYEEHMARWKAHYQWMAELLPASIESLLDIGCGTGLGWTTSLPAFGFTDRRVDISKKCCGNCIQNTGTRI